MSSDARAYLATKRAGQLHPAFDMSNTRWDPLREKYASKDGHESSIQQAADHHTAHFISVMKFITENASSASTLQNFDIKQAHDWVEVRREAALVSQEKYKDKAKGFKGIFPRIARKIGEMNPAIEPMATTLPAGEYTSLVCGGIVLLFKAFDRVTKVREKVIDTLGEYPDLLDNVERLLRLYKDDLKLARHATSLYIALLVAIEGMIVWFEETTWKRLKAFMQQGLYAKDLEDKIAHLHRCGSELKSSADLCDKERTTEAFLVVQASLEAIDDLGDEIRRTGSESLAAIGESRDDIKSEITRSGDLNRAALEHLGVVLSTETRQEAIKVQNNILKQLSEYQRDWEAKTEAKAEAKAEARAREAIAEARALRESERALRESEKTLRETEKTLREKADTLQKELDTNRQPPTLSQQYIQQLLGPQIQDPDEIATAYTKFSRVQTSQADITTTILKHPKFRQWYSMDKSQSLVIIPPATTAKTKSGSYAAAALFSAFSLTKTATTLAYFCGKDRSNHPEDEPQNLAIKMLRNLIQQLLNTHAYDLSDWTSVTSLHDHHDYLFYMYGGNISYLCSFFKYLVRSAPCGAVFCIMDDIRQLERCGSDLEDLDIVVDMIRDLCDEDDTTTTAVASFKAILFTPQHKGYVVKRTKFWETIRITNVAAAQVGHVTSKKMSYRLKSDENVNVEFEIQEISS